MHKIFILVLIIFVSPEIFSQTFFEGDIAYKFSLQKKDSSFDETLIVTYPAKTTIGIYKNGDWLQKPDDGMIEYYYFNHSENKFYWKFRNNDTLLYEIGDKQKETEVDSALTTRIDYNTDTILGFSCNRLIIQTNELKLIFIYTPNFAINPVWYQSTKMNYYDIIYGLTKAIYLKSIVETREYISTMTVHYIRQRKVSDSEFPDTKKLATEKL